MRPRHAGSRRESAGDVDRRSCCNGQRLGAAVARTQCPIQYKEHTAPAALHSRPCLEDVLAVGVAVILSLSHQPLLAQRLHGRQVAWGVAELAVRKTRRQRIMGVRIME